MGLDAVELLMEIEEAFDITISEKAVEKMVTVGDVYEYILRHKKEEAQVGPALCLTAVTFYKLRRLFMAELGLVRRELRPDTPIDSILPARERRNVWLQLERALQLKLPAFTLSRSLQSLCWLASATAAGALAIFMLPVFPLMVTVMTCSLCFVGLLLASHVVAERWATAPTPAFATLGGLARVVMAKNLTAIREQYAGPNPADTWDVLQAIIVAQLGVAPAEVTPSANFVYDLGIG